MKLANRTFIRTTLLATSTISNAYEEVQAVSEKQATTLISSVFDYTIAQSKAPADIKLLNKTVGHPVFGKMYVISHKDEIESYNKRITKCLPNDIRNELVDNFLYYVAEIRSSEITIDELREALFKMSATKVGMNTLKVITSKYMQQYEQYKKFYDNNEMVLNKYLNADKRIAEIDDSLEKDNKLRTNEYQKLKSLDKKNKIWKT